jgi:hypothetical protein
MPGLLRPRCLALAAALALTVAFASGAAASPTLQLQTTRSALLSDGKQTTEVRAFVRDASGRLVTTPTEVQFQTTAGTLSAPSATTFGGVARVRLTSANVPGTAHITAFAPGGGNDVIDVLFSDDPNDLFEGNAYINMTGGKSVSYSASDRILMAQGAKTLARLTYRNIEITAGAIQLHCDDLVVRARDRVTLKRGKSTIQVTRLFYSLLDSKGYGLGDIDGRVAPIEITGNPPKAMRSSRSIPNSYLNFKEMAVKLIVVAQSATLFPNEKLQFRRPHFYQDTQLLMSMPYYELALHSSELFSDHFISVGTSGLGLQLPYYYNLTPTSTGIVYLRHQQQIGRGYFATDPGWAIDVLQGYSSAGSTRYEGAYGFTGLLRSDWGFRWTHSQEFTSASQGSLYLDFPNHDSVFSSLNYTQQAKFLHWGLDLSGGEAFSGVPNNSENSNFYVESNPYRLTKTMSLTLGSSTTQEHVYAAGVTQSETLEDLTMRTSSRPVHLDKLTTFTNTETLGQMWTNQGASGIEALATFSLDHTVPHGGTLNLSYDLITQPHTLEYTGGNSRMSLSYTMPTGHKLQVTLFGSEYLDTSGTSLIGDVAYRVDSHWRLLMDATLERFAGDSYEDFEFTVGRRLGTRELQLTYSTFLKRISFDFTATNW